MSETYSKTTDVFTFIFFFVFFSFLALHYAHMKTPAQYRQVASQHAEVQFWYDASFKY